MTGIDNLGIDGQHLLDCGCGSYAPTEKTPLVSHLRSGSRVAVHNLPNGDAIVDFGRESSLLLISGELLSPFYGGDVAVSYNRRTTKQGRPLVSIGAPGRFETAGTLTWQHGSGCRSWENWDERRFIEQDGVEFALAAATSNGGGCWLEFTLVREGVTPITAAQAAALEMVE